MKIKPKSGKIRLLKAGGVKRTQNKVITRSSRLNSVAGDSYSKKLSTPSKGSQKRIPRRRASLPTKNVAQQSKFLNIIGACEIRNNMLFYMNFSTGPRIVTGAEAYRDFLNEVIKFFEENLVFSTEKRLEQVDLPSKIRIRSYGRDLKATKICGAFRIKKGLVFIVEFEEDIVELFMASTANLRWPKLVLDFYLARISWVSNSNIKNE